MKMYKRLAKTYSFNYKSKRNLKDIKCIVIHYTSGVSDTARNEVDYFATNNTRLAGAHFFVDTKGEVGRSVPSNRTAWSVGGCYNTYNGAGKYYNKYTNYNTVSIELCGIGTGFATKEQIESLKLLVKHIKRHCPNVKEICRHYDINGKVCPAGYVKDEAAWQKLRSKLMEVLNG